MAASIGFLQAPRHTSETPDSAVFAQPSSDNRIKTPRLQGWLTAHIHFQVPSPSSCSTILACRRAFAKKMTNVVSSVTPSRRHALVLPILPHAVNTHCSEVDSLVVGAESGWLKLLFRCPCSQIRCAFTFRRTLQLPVLRCNSKRTGLVSIAETTNKRKSREIASSAERSSTPWP